MVGTHRLVLGVSAFWEGGGGGQGLGGSTGAGTGAWDWVGGDGERVSDAGSLVVLSLGWRVGAGASEGLF